MKSNSIKTRICGAALAGLFMIVTAAATPARAAVPGLINFQGKLADSNGKAVTGIVPMVFKFYTTAAGGSPVWAETQNVTPDNYGIYSVMLGEVTPLNISFSTAYWMGVAVGTDGEMQPRYKIVSSAYSLYALNSATAAWAGGADWSMITNKPAVTTQGNAFNGSSQLVQLLSDGFLPVLNGSNLTGLPATSIAAGSVTNAMLVNGAVANLSGANTGDDAVNPLYSGFVTNAAHTGDATGATALTVVKINGTQLSGLATGILRNTTGTGVPSIAVAGDFPVLDQNTTGNAATATSLTGLTATITDLNSVTGALGTAAFTAIGAYATAAQGTLAANALPSVSFTDAAVTGKLITGYASGAGVVAEGDSILEAINKLSGNIAAKGNGTLTGVTGTAPVASSGGNAPAISMAAASSGVDGYMTGAYAAKLDGIAAGANLYVHQDHTGEVTSAADGAQIIAVNVVTNAKAAQMAAKTYKGRTSALTGNAEDVAVATLKTDLGLTKGDVGLSDVPNLSFSGSNTGDDAVNPLYSGFVTNAAHTGDATGATALTVVKINGTQLSGLATGILRNTTGTGVPSIAVAGDFPVLDQNTTGNAATATSLTGLTATIANLNSVTGALGTAAFTAIGAYATAAQGTLAANALPSVSFTDAAVTGKLITGYASGAGVVAEGDSILEAINKLSGNIASGGGDVYKASTQTFTGLNTFTSTVTAMGFVNASQSVVLNNGAPATFAADGSGVVLLNQVAGIHPISTITGCGSGAVGQGQTVTFVVAAYGTDALSFLDTDIGSVADNRMLLNGSVNNWELINPASIGSTITLLCTTIGSAKAWVEIGRSKANGVGT